MRYCVASWKRSLLSKLKSLTKRTATVIRLSPFAAFMVAAVALPLSTPTSQAAIPLLSLVDVILIWLVGLLSVALFTLFLHFRGVGRTARLVVLIVLLLGVIAGSWVFAQKVLKPTPVKIPALKEAQTYPAAR